MNIKRNYSLKSLNSFGLDVASKEFISINSEEELIELIDSRDLAEENYLILGEGSNILFSGDFDGLIIKSNISNIKVVDENRDRIIIESGSGVKWDDFVAYSVDQGFYGIENLSLIPGTVGAAPIQNIGAYGVELDSVFIDLDAIDLHTGEKKVFSKEDCEFGYRDSIFKRNYKNRFFITKVRLRLEKNQKLRLSYRAIQDFIKENSIDREELDLRKLRGIIIAIRKSKLPDPQEIGNAGSFFKNPIIDNQLFGELKGKYRDLVFFKLTEEEIKIPAAWLIEKAGFKGRRYGEVGVHNKQALVLVNYGDATGGELIDLSKKIKTEIFNKFSIDLETEVNIV